MTIAWAAIGGLALGALLAVAWIIYDSRKYPFPPCPGLFKDGDPLSNKELADWAEITLMADLRARERPRKDAQ